MDADSIAAGGIFSIGSGITIGGVTGGNVDVGSAGRFVGTIRTDSNTADFNLIGAYGNTGGTLTVDTSAGGKIAMQGAQISGGTLAITGTLSVDDQVTNELNGVTINGGEIAIQNNSRLALQNTVTLNNSTISLNSTDISAARLGAATNAIATIAGTGNINLNGTSTFNALDADSIAVGGVFDIGSGIIVGGVTGALSIYLAAIWQVP